MFGFLSVGCFCYCVWESRGRQGGYGGFWILTDYVSVVLSVALTFFVCRFDFLSKSLAHSTHPPPPPTHPHPPPTHPHPCIVGLWPIKFHSPPPPNPSSLPPSLHCLPSTVSFCFWHFSVSFCTCSSLNAPLHLLSYWALKQTLWFQQYNYHRRWHFRHYSCVNSLFFWVFTSNPLNMWNLHWCACN